MPSVSEPRRARPKPSPSKKLAAARRAAPKRVRRSPEEARALILEAAERVLAERGPDAAGLKDVAREAGVSHALVSHYFGTYDSLVEAVFEGYVARVRTGLLTHLAGLSGGGAADVDRLVDDFFETVAEPSYARLALWALLSGRLDAKDFFARKKQGMRLVADAIEAAAARGPEELLVDRAGLELLLVEVLASGFGYLLGASVFWESLGRKATEERDEAFRRSLAERIRSSLYGPRGPANAPRAQSSPSTA
jgi:TetR/AcrR family transcriptional regulator, repressor for neighboring sulfatase